MEGVSGEAGVASLQGLAIGLWVSVWEGVWISALRWSRLLNGGPCG